jgi:hypothetical protein
MSRPQLSTGQRKTGTPEGRPQGAAMITNDEQLDQAMEQLARMYRALADLRKDNLPAKTFALMAEGPVDEIRRRDE